MKILIVEDDPKTREILRVYLADQGHEILEAEDGIIALEQFTRHRDCDLVLLDLILPKLDGWAVLASIRRESNVPIIVITARDHIDDRIRGLKSGGDDYIVKPFDLGELEARIEAVLRRYRPESPTKIRINDLEIDDECKEVRLQGRLIPLAPKEYALLRLLASKPGKVFSEEEIISALWPNKGMTANDVAQCVYRLRRKLEADPAHPQWILTAPGFGYQLRAKN